MFSVSKFLEKGLLLVAVLAAPLFASDNSDYDDSNKRYFDEIFEAGRHSSYHAKEAYREPGTNTYVLPAKGEFASIDTKASHAILEKIIKGDKGALKEAVRNPNRYNPEVLFVAGLMKAYQGFLDEAASLIAYGKLRIIVDCMWCQDVPSTSAVMTNLQMGFMQLQRCLGDEKFELLDKKIQQAYLTFEAWDRKTSRDYDYRWPLLSGLQPYFRTTIEKKITGEDRQAKLEMFYRTLKGELLPEDVEHVSPEADYFFDMKKDRFSLQVDGEKVVSIKVPSKCYPILDVLGREYGSVLKFRQKTNSIVFYCEKCSKKTLFEDLYKIECEYLETGVKVEKCLINGVQSYKKHRAIGDSVFHEYGFFGENRVHFSMALYTDQENEKQDLATLEEIIGSITWHEQETNDA